jgi:hypothetical protein
MHGLYGHGRSQIPAIGKTRRLIAHRGRKSKLRRILAELDAECRRLPLLGRSVPRTEPKRAREEGNDVVTNWSV